MALIEDTITVDGVVIRRQRPAGAGPLPVILMLHGWTGDENSMWVFAPRLPKNAMLIAPRGLYKAVEKGYSWHAEISRRWPWANDFQPAVKKLIDIITVNNFPEGDFSEMHVIGFSQGSAMAYTLTLMYPEHIASLVGLSGFMPDGISSWLRPERLAGLPVFIAHGSDDELVPVDKARQSAELLESAGAVVTYCEDNVGHRLSPKCFHGLEAFYKNLKSTGFKSDQRI